MYIDALCLNISDRKWVPSCFLSLKKVVMKIFWVNTHSSGHLLSVEIRHWLPNPWKTAWCWLLFNVWIWVPPLDNNKCCSLELNALACDGPFLCSNCDHLVICFFLSSFNVLLINSQSTQYKLSTLTIWWYTFRKGGENVAHCKQLKFPFYTTCSSDCLM